MPGPSLFLGTSPKIRGAAHTLLSLVAATLLGTGMLNAQSLTTLASFNGINGKNPMYGSLLADAKGNLFGTTCCGGASRSGNVFMIEKTASGYATTPTELASFDGPHGAVPLSGLIADSDGNLYGTTSTGGALGLGTVFKIEKTASGYNPTPVVLFSFDGLHGSRPESGLIADSNGNLYGTTAILGPHGYGTVFRIDKVAGGFATAPVLLAGFDGIHGSNPNSNLIADSAGNLYGTTYEGGRDWMGTVFKIEKTVSGYASTPTILYSFDASQANGAYPMGSLVFDSNGNLYGTTAWGGTFSQGAAFRIAKTASGYANTTTTLFHFDGTHGANPVSGLIVDANGNLFGTTDNGGSAGKGTVFKIEKTATGYAPTPIVLSSFSGSQDGSVPVASLIADMSGNLYGTTADGGASNAGTVFQLAGSGFVPPRRFAGNPGTANCRGASLTDLSRTFGGLAAAAKALGFANVADLQAAIAAYCGK
jgi:uncharacterized repeat protein (TIGR03803 family)